MTYLVSLEIFENKQVAEILFNRNLMGHQGSSVNDILATAEFQVLKTIALHGQISPESLESKYGTQSLPMMLSNLQADDLIFQTADNEWKLSEWLVKLINDMSVESLAIQKKIEQEQKALQAQKMQEFKEQRIKNVIAALSSTQYLPQEYETYEELWKVPEFEVIMLIIEHQPVSTEKIETLVQTDASLSMILSNLQADNLITEGMDFAWVITDQVAKHLAGDAIRSEKDDATTSIDDEQPSFGLSQADAILLEYNQLLKAITELQYFQVESRENIVHLPEFLILYTIHANSPIPGIEIHEKLPDVPVTMLMSNLQADGLIEEYENDWILSDDFRKKIMKTQISKDDILHPVILATAESTSKIVEEPKSKSIPEEPSPDETVQIPDAVSHVTQSEDTNNEAQKENLADYQKQNNIVDPVIPEGHNSVLTIEETQLVKVAYNAGYVPSTDLTFHELIDIPEFEVLKIIQNNGPLTITDLKKFALSVSPVLITRTISKLEADEKIVQNEDGYWYFTEQLNQELIDGIVKERKKKEEEEQQIRLREQTKMTQERTDQTKSLAKYLTGIGYIQPESSDFNHLRSIVEFEVLSTILLEGTATTDTIKKEMQDITPVQINHVIAKLEADHLIINDEGQWRLSDKLKREIYH
ncbi:MAG: hypothetical protein ACXAB7_18075 [Candidatus Kariarchaeaceae archaeon]